MGNLPDLQFVFAIIGPIIFGIIVAFIILRIQKMGRKPISEFDSKAISALFWKTVRDYPPDKDLQVHITEVRKAFVLVFHVDPMIAEP